MKEQGISKEVAESFAKETARIMDLIDELFLVNKTHSNPSFFALQMCCAKYIQRTGQTYERYCNYLDSAKDFGKVYWDHESKE